MCPPLPVPSHLLTPPPPGPLLLLPCFRSHVEVAGRRYLKTEYFLRAGECPSNYREVAAAWEAKAAGAGSAAAGNSGGLAGATGGTGGTASAGSNLVGSGAGTSGPAGAGNATSAAAVTASVDISGAGNGSGSGAAQAAAGEAGDAPSQAPTGPADPVLRTAAAAAPPPLAEGLLPIGVATYTKLFSDAELAAIEAASGEGLKGRGKGVQWGQLVGGFTHRGGMLRG